MAKKLRDPPPAYKAVIEWALIGWFGSLSTKDRELYNSILQIGVKQ
jgi:hypothetical protein